MRAPWADCDEAEAGEWWSSAVDAVREAAGAGESAYIELSYEELDEEPVGAVTRLLGELGLDAGEQVRRRLESVSRERISSFGPPAASAGADSPKAVGGGRGQRPSEAAGIAGELRERASGLAKRLGNRAESRTRTAQALLVAARRGNAAEVAELTHPSFQFQLRSGVGDLAANGDEGREALIELAAEIFHSQAVSESWTAVSEGEITVLMFAAGHGDGSRTDLVATALVRDAVVERLGLIAAGAPGGRPPSQWRRRPVGEGRA